MKRSEINSAIKEMERLAKTYHFELPPFCFFSPEDWRMKGREFNEIRDCLLGWDITDFGYDDFSKIGMSLVTLRNGMLGDSRYPKTYAEKLIMMHDGQKAPMHYHWTKREDIINRGGGMLLITVCNGHPDRSKDDRDVPVSMDGRSYSVPSGTAVVVKPGESISIPPYQYHSFSIVSGTGDVLIGEVSMCNDDASDNCFYIPKERFPSIEEDVKPYRLLCTEYPPA